MLTIERLKELLYYNEQTGQLIWKSTFKNRIAGKIAGTICRDGYRNVRLDKENYKAHRLVWFYKTGVWPKEDLDHINRNRDDNRFSNLREATRSENCINKGARKDNLSSGIKNVSWNKQRSKWHVAIQKDGKKTFLGLYDSLDEAKKVAESGRKTLHNQFANNG
jgi:hypothetical protein